MLMSLICLSDEEIEIVTSAVREWCRAHHHDIDSSEGRRALTIAVDLVQSKHSGERIVALLGQRMNPMPDATLPERHAI